ncbi:MAG: c-type cytochrome [Gammaproteobacteria bacterium]
MKKLTVIFAALGIALASGSALAGDAAAGEAAFNGKGCAACHGAGGAAPTTPLYPKLAGQSAQYTAKTLNDFKSGARKDATMNAMAAMLNDADVANVAAYLAAQ